MLTCSKRYYPLHTIQRMYNSIVDPHLRYFCSFWGCAGDSIIKKLLKLQNRAARVATNSPNNQSSLPLILQLGWLKVKEMIDFETGCTVYKVLKVLAPPYMQSLFHSRSESSNRNLRNTSTDLKIPFFKTFKGQHSFSYGGVAIWNQVSHDIKLLLRYLRNP